jgi:GTP-binding protein
VEAAVVKVLSAEFLVSAVSPAQYPRHALPEVAFAGRSNVGKSSLINTLAHRRGLAKTSATPGKTQTINFFLVNHRFLLVDLPGYGYAKVPQEVQARWRPMIEAYLQHRQTLCGIVHIVDIRHPPTAQDQQLRAWLQVHNVPMVTVATKADKITTGQRAEHMRMVRQGLGLAIDEPLCVFSAHNREGRAQLWKYLEAFLLPSKRDIGVHSRRG